MNLPHGRYRKESCTRCHEAMKEEVRSRTLRTLLGRVTSIFPKSQLPINWQQRKFPDFDCSLLSVLGNRSAPCAGFLSAAFKQFLVAF
jgi:hypothetical protein